MNIILIFSKPDVRVAEEVEHFLLEESSTAILSRQEGKITFETSNRAYSQDSAIVVVTDEAVDDRLWQEHVRTLTPGIRLIPVGMTENVNYDDPSVIPPELSEVNFIPLDDNTLLFIKDSLTTPPGLYELTTLINDQMKHWDGTDSALLDNVKFIKDARIKIKIRLDYEQDPVLLDRLHQMESFLKKSLRYARKQSLSRWRYYVQAVICFIISALSLYVLLIKMPGALKLRQEQLHYGHTLTWRTPEEDPLTVAIGALYIAVDKPASENILWVARRSLESALNEPHWPGPLLGDDYRYALNDYVASLDGEGKLRILTCDGNGYVSQWDLNTANIADQTQVSSRPLYKIASDGAMLAVIDFDGKVYLRHGEKSGWVPLQEFSPVFPHSLLFQNECLVAYNDQTLILYNLSSSNVVTKKFDRIYDAEFLTDDTLAMLVKKEHTLEYLRILPSGGTESHPFEGQLSQKNSRGKLVDISANGDLVYLNSQLEMVYWNHSRPSEHILTGFYSSRPSSIYLYPDQVAAVADIDRGIHLYDMRRNMLLGRLHLPVASPQFVSGFEDYLFAGDDNGRLSFRKISDFKVTSAPAKDQVLARYDKTAHTMDSGKIRDVHPILEDSLLMSLAVENRSISMILNGKGQNRQSFDYWKEIKAALPEGTDPQSILTVTGYLGQPCVVGILPDIDGLVFGTTAGYFNALLIRDDGTYVEQRRIIPSHLPIKSIQVGTNSYWLTDSAENCWHVARVKLRENNVALAEELAKHAPLLVDHDTFKALPDWMIKRFELIEMPYSDEGYWGVD